MDTINIFNPAPKYQAVMNEKDSLKDTKDSLIIRNNSLNKLIAEGTIMKPLFPLKVDVSYYSPTSIFDGQVLITAKEEFGKAIIEFKGIMGIAKEVTESFGTLKIEVKEGDRFYFRSEQSKTFAVNVLSTSINVDLEIIEKK